MSDDGTRPRVVVLGGGFAGLGAARGLKDVDADVVLVDQRDYHTFQPMLYQVASALVSPSTVAHPLRTLFREQQNVSVRTATVSGIDPQRREVQLEGSEPLRYDQLILALGAQVNFFGTEGAVEHAFPMYTLPDAVRLKDQVLDRWEAAAREPSLIDDGALNVVVVGGGPTGVETAGALSELYQGTLLEDYPEIPPDKARIILVEAGPELFSMFHPKLRTYVVRALEKRRVEVRTGERVHSVEPTRVTLASGTVLEAHTLVWGAGLQASPLARSFLTQLEHGGRLSVEPDLSLSAHPDVFAVGDIAAIPTDDGDGPLPQLGSVALQAGELAGENAGRRLRGQDTEPFRYHDKGTMATIGRGAAVIQLKGGRTMKGKAAWLAWGAVHLALLSNGEDRTKAMLDWTWASFTRERGARIRV